MVYQWRRKGKSKQQQQKTNQKPKTQIQPGNGEVKDKRWEANHGAFYCDTGSAPVLSGVNQTFSGAMN